VNAPRDQADPLCEGDTKAAEAPDPQPSTRASLLRLERTAPLIARELHASWSDPQRASRLIEEFLGGERDVQMEAPALIELIQLYQCLELHRATSAADKAMLSDLGIAATRALDPASMI
jgi:hypothetical protein